MTDTHNAHLLKHFEGVKTEETNHQEKRSLAASAVFATVEDADSDDDVDDKKPRTPEQAPAVPMAPTGPRDTLGSLTTTTTTTADAKTDDVETTFTDDETRITESVVDDSMVLLAAHLEELEHDHHFRGLAIKYVGMDVAPCKQGEAPKSNQKQKATKKPAVFYQFATQNTWSRIEQLNVDDKAKTKVLSVATVEMARKMAADQSQSVIVIFDFENKIPGTFATRAIAILALMWDYKTLCVEILPTTNAQIMRRRIESSAFARTMADFVPITTLEMGPRATAHQALLTQLGSNCIDKRRKIYKAFSESTFPVNVRYAIVVFDIHTRVKKAEDEAKPLKADVQACFVRYDCETGAREAALNTRAQVESMREKQIKSKTSVLMLDNVLAEMRRTDGEPGDVVFVVETLYYGVLCRFSTTSYKRVNVYKAAEGVDEEREKLGLTATKISQEESHVEAEMQKNLNQHNQAAAANGKKSGKKVNDRE